MYDCFELEADGDFRTRPSSETPDIVCLSDADKKLYKTLFSSALISYNRLTVGDDIGEGMLPAVCSTSCTIK